MARTSHLVSTLARGAFAVYDSSNVAVTGLVTGSFTRLLQKDGVDDATAVSIVEVGNGRYEATFTPGSTGVWTLLVRHATHNPRGWQETFDVAAVDLAGVGANVDQLGTDLAAAAAAIADVGADVDLVAAGVASVATDVDGLEVAVAALPSAAATATAVGALTKDGLTLLDHLGAQSAMLAGKVSGGPGNITVRSVDDQRDAVLITADEDGNRSSVTVNP